MELHNPAACPCLKEDGERCPQCVAELADDLPLLVVVIHRFATGWRMPTGPRGPSLHSEYTYETPVGLYRIGNDHHVASRGLWYGLYLPGDYFVHDVAEGLAAAERLVCRAVAKATAQRAVQVRTRPGIPRGRAT